MEEIPDLNIFMMCRELNRNALTELASQYSIRNCRRSELGIWKAMPFDDAATAQEYESFMTEFFQTTYGRKEDLFFAATKFVCDQEDRPIATCALWKAYDEFYAIHWFKVVPNYEGLGIGRALLSIIMKDLPAAYYPIYLHTQPGSYRAIKLYSDFGFCLVSNEKLGSRPNDLEVCLPFLEKYMPQKDFENLKIVKAPESFERTLEQYSSHQF